MTLTVRIDADDIRSADMLLQDGWREGDELVIYRRTSGPRLHGHPAIRGAIIEDVESVVALANMAFSPKDKTHWIQDAFDRNDRRIYVAEQHGRIAGFLITRKEPETLVIDLIGTGPRLGGYGKSLIEHAEFSEPEPFTQAGTQIHNADAREFYAALEFQVVKIRRTFHK